MMAVTTKGLVLTAQVVKVSQKMSKELFAY